MQLLILRFCVGVGVGGSTVPFDIFAEFLPPSIRGRSLMLTNLFWTVGELYVIFAAYMLLPDYGWRGLVFSSAAPVTIGALLTFWILPESPRWLITQGRYKEAEDIVRQCAESSSTKPAPFTFDPAKKFPGRGGSKELVDDISPRESSSADAVDTSSNKSLYALVCEHFVHTLKVYSDLLTGEKLRVTTLKIGSVWAIFGFAYYGVVLLITRIYQSKAPSDAAPHANSNAVCAFDYASIAVNTSSEFFSILGVMLIIDRIGRRSSQIGTYGAGAVALVVMGSVPLRSQTPSTILMLGYIMRMTSMASSCTTWVVTPELYPTNVRASAHSLVNTFARLGALCSPFLVVSTIPTTTVAFVLGMCNILAAIAAWSLHETMGKAMDDDPKVGDDETQKVLVVDNPIVKA